MIDPHFVAFAGVALLLTLSPGPDMALMLRNVLRGGGRVVFATTLGTCLGLLFWAAASSLGIAALMASSAELFTLLRLVGAAYLVWLGAGALRTAWEGDRAFRAEAEAVAPAAAAGSGPGAAPLRAPLTRTAAFRNALVANLFNPKIGVFYATLLPQFIPPGFPALGASLILASIHAAEGIVWLSLYGYLLARFGDHLLRGRGRRILESVSGTVLLALGARVALEVVSGE